MIKETELILTDVAKLKELQNSNRNEYGRIQPPTTEMKTILTKLIKERNELRKTKNYQITDVLRLELLNLGFEIRDHKDGTTSWAWD